MSGLTNGKNAANYIFWLNGLEPVMQETPDNRDKGPKSGGPLELDHIQFSYPLRPDTSVLKGVDLHVSHVFNVIGLKKPLTCATSQ